MTDWLIAHEIGLRLFAFFGVLGLMATLETAFPRRPRKLPRRLRWPHNLALVALDSLLARLLFPAAAVGFALHAESAGLGLLPRLALPGWLAVLLALLLLDLAIWAQHLVFHKLPWLWRLHRVHHADQDIDVTTGARFHPLEIVLSYLIKLALVLALGAPVAAVLLFELVLNAMALFNHANLRLPAWLDTILRRLLVTPDMHRVHHSREPDETDSNYGFNLAIWDRLFGTYRARPRHGHAGMAIGLAGEDDPRRTNRLDGMLAMPFVSRRS